MNTLLGASPMANPREQLLESSPQRFPPFFLAFPSLGRAFLPFLEIGLYPPEKPLFPSVPPPNALSQLCSFLIASKGLLKSCDLSLISSKNTRKHNQRVTLMLLEFYGHPNNSKARFPTCISESGIDIAIWGIAANPGFIKDCHFLMKAGPTVKQQWYTQTKIIKGIHYSCRQAIFTWHVILPLCQLHQEYICPYLLAPMFAFRDPLVFLWFRITAVNLLYYFLSQWCIPPGRHVDYVFKKTSSRDAGVTP
ncbi:hypothetical protein VNO77_38943 [Canavalia gladiata]|uniref:Uncharacterized protein n=1 Tax=Canavalia gladiata TaxID=3824 RepID=A0AAN9PWP4_CANGL